MQIFFDFLTLLGSVVTTVVLVFVLIALEIVLFCALGIRFVVQNVVETFQLFKYMRENK